MIRRSSFKFKVPSFSYPGGKVRMRDWLISMMPKKCNTYCEPFAGRGNVFWKASHVINARAWWLNDLWTARWFEVISSSSCVGMIPMKLDHTKSVEMRRRAVENRATDDLAVLLESITMFSGGVAASGSSPLHMKKFNSDSFKNTIRCAQRIIRAKNPRITALDWQDVTSQLIPDDFAYLDPPYEINNAGYAVDTVNHNELLNTLLCSKFMWLLSGFRSDLYDKLLGKPFAQMSRRTSMCFGGTDRHEDQIEYVWRNY